jgi:predicted heme/steroid binding protein
MTLDELKQFDGKEGRKALVAVNGRIYDVTDSPLWNDGNHQELHQAGRDLTEDLKGAPHVRMVMDRFSIVGELQPPASQAGGKKLWLVGALLVALILVVLLMI